jgi:cytochrome c biogenesis protein CcmG, thiol:disulfide interchange protein DsbE
MTRRPSRIWTDGARRAVARLFPVLVLLLALPTGAGVTVGARAELRLPTLGGDALALSSLVGSVVLVDFWATWCEPCRVSFPFYAELLERYGERGFEVVAVSVDERREEVERFVAREGLPFRVVLDSDHEAVRTFAPETMPTAYLLDRTGVVRHVHEGFAPGDREGLEALVRALLEEPAPASAAGVIHVTQE